MKWRWKDTCLHVGGGMEEEKGGGSRSSFEMYLIYIYIFLTKFDLDFVIHFKDLAESSVHPTCCAIDPPVGSTLIASLAATTFFTYVQVVK